VLHERCPHSPAGSAHLCGCESATRLRGQDAHPLDLRTLLHNLDNGLLPGLTHCAGLVHSGALEAMLAPAGSTLQSAVHSLTHGLTHSLTRGLTGSLTHSRAGSRAHSLAHARHLLEGLGALGLPTNAPGKGRYGARGRLSPPHWSLLASPGLAKLRDITGGKMQAPTLRTCS